LTTFGHHAEILSTAGQVPFSGSATLSLKNFGAVHDRL